jgi:hypothetical protein
MKFYKSGVGLALAAVTISQTLAQTRVDLHSQTKNVDFSNAATTKPSKTGTVLAATCSVGETFFKTDAPPGQNLYACTAVNVWSAQGGGTQTMNSVFGRTGSVTATGGDYSASQVTNAADKTVANLYVAGARQTFTPNAGASGLRLTPGALPGSPQAGDLAVDSNDSNHAKVFDGTSWVNMTTGPYSTIFTLATTVTVPGATHKLGTPNLVVELYDSQSPAQRVEPDHIAINPSTFDVTVVFQTPQSGRVVIR